MPAALLVGDSHIDYYRQWWQKYEQAEDDLLCKERAVFVSASDATWSNMKDRLQGINLPRHQKARGDQWTRLTQSSFNPRFIVICLGTNDINGILRKLVKLRRSTSGYQEYKRLQYKILIQGLANMQKGCKELICFLKHAYPDARLLLMGNYKRNWWSLSEIHLMMCMGLYINKIIKAKVIDMNKKVPKAFRWDGICRRSYTFFNRKVMSKLFHMYYDKHNVSHFSKF